MPEERSVSDESRTVEYASPVRAVPDVNGNVRPVFNVFGQAPRRTAEGAGGVDRRGGRPLAERPGEEDRAEGVRRHGDARADVARDRDEPGEGVSRGAEGHPGDPVADGEEPPDAGDRGTGRDLGGVQAEPAGELRGASAGRDPDPHGGRLPIEGEVMPKNAPAVMPAPVRAKPAPPRLPEHLHPILFVTSSGERFHATQSCQALKRSVSIGRHDLCWSCFDECGEAWRQRALLMDHRGVLHVQRGCSYERWTEARPGRNLRPCQICIGQRQGA